MSRTVKSPNEEVLRRTARRCRERGIVVPTFAQMRDPARILAPVARRLAGVGANAVEPANLFRITWKNDPRTGGFAGPNQLEIPRAITGVRARIVGMVGKHFPTGAHKVGAAFGCLVPPSLCSAPPAACAFFRSSASRNLRLVSSFGLDSFGMTAA